MQLENLQLRAGLRKLGEHCGAQDLAEHYEQQITDLQQQVWRLQDECAKYEADERPGNPRVLRDLQNEVAQVRAQKAEQGKSERSLKLAQRCLRELHKKLQGAAQARATAEQRASLEAQRAHALDTELQQLKADLAESHRDVSALQRECSGMREEIAVLRDAQLLAGTSRRKEDLLTKFLVPHVKKSAQRNAACLDLFGRVQREVAAAAPHLSASLSRLKFEVETVVTAFGELEQKCQQLGRVMQDAAVAEVENRRPSPLRERSATPSRAPSCAAPWSASPRRGSRPPAAKPRAEVRGASIGPTPRAPSRPPSPGRPPSNRSPSVEREAKELTGNRGFNKIKTPEDGYGSRMRC